MKCISELSALTVFLLLSFANFSNADWISMDFSIEVEEWRDDVPDFPADYGNINASPIYYTHGKPGESFLGHIMYNDNNIPQTGSFTQKYSSDYLLYDPQNIGFIEHYAWWQSPYFGSDPRTSRGIHFSELFFSDGKLTGFNLVNHPDLYTLDDERIFNGRYIANGMFMYNIYVPETMDYEFYDGNATITGIVHFPVNVPEPELSILSFFVLIGIFFIKGSQHIGKLFT